jgi:DNA-binding CsgD family transcriptional regulator
MYLDDSIREGAFLYLILPFLTCLSLTVFVCSRKIVEHKKALLIYVGLVGLLFTWFGSLIIYLLLEVPPQTLQILQRNGNILAAACVGIGSGFLIYCWELILELYSKNYQIVCIIFWTASACTLTFLSFLLTSKAMLIITVSGSSLSLIFILALVKKDSSPFPHATKSVNSSNNTKLLSYYSKTLVTRFMLATFLLGIAFGLMGYIFVAATDNRSDINIWVSVFLGLLSLIAILIVSHLINKEFDVVFTLRAASFLTIPAFFPMEPGTPLSLDFAMVFTLAACVATMSAMLLVQSEVTKTLGRAYRKARGIFWFVMPLGLGTGICMVLALISLNSNFFYLSKTIKLSVAGLAAIILVLFSTMAIINKEIFRKVLIVSEGKLSISIDFAKSFSSDTGIIDEVSLARYQRIALQKGLTPREIEICIILARGNNMQRVQDELFISKGTAITHRNHIYKKLGVHSKQELIDFVTNFKIDY